MAFENMRSLVHEYAGAGYDVTVLPITRFDIAPDMSGITPATDNVIDEYYSEGSEAVKVSRDESLVDAGFDIIVTNYPYDEYNLITAVDKKFYSGQLRAKCKKLIYVPPFEPVSIGPDDERAKKLMPSYVCTPMTSVCDEIVLHSDEMKERYVECLSDFSGESFRCRWEQKIKVLPAAYDKTEDKTTEQKHKILFYVGIAAFAQYKEGAIEKIKKVFDTFAQNADRIDAVYITQDNFKENLKELYPGVYEEYAANDFREYSEDISIDEIDAYYGESSVYATMLMDMGRPCMIWNVEI
jgi:hypothetical protein